MLKNAYFLEKTVNNRFSVGGSSPERPFASGSPNPGVFALAYYYNFVKFISSVKCVLLLSKRNKITTVNVLFLLLPHLYFSLQTTDVARNFDWGGNQNRKIL